MSSHASLLHEVWTPLKFIAVSALSVTSTVLAFEFGAAEITAVSLVIAAVGVVIVNVLTAVLAARTARINTKLDVVARIDSKLDVVAGHVNSAASEAKTLNEALQKEISSLKGVIAEQKQIAALLAQATAQSSTPGGLAAPIADVQTVKNIETNTKDTADALKDTK